MHSTLCNVHCTVLCMLCSLFSLCTVHCTAGCTVKCVMQARGRGLAVSKRENSWTNIGYRLGGSEFVGRQAAEKEIWRVGEREGGKEGGIDRGMEGGMEVGEREGRNKGGREGTEEEEEEMGKRMRSKRE